MEADKKDLFMQNHYDKVMYLCGLMEQLGTITEAMGKEKLNLENQKLTAKPEIYHSTSNSVVASIPIINGTFEAALKSSIIFFQFSVIEAAVSVLSDLIIQINENAYFPPVFALSESEIDFVAETITTFDGKKGKIIQKSAYRRLEDRVEQIPLLFAKQMEVNFALTGKDRYWQDFLNLKSLRDRLTHPKTQRVYIDDKAIFEGAEVIFWIYEGYFNLIQGTLYPTDGLLLKHILNAILKLILATYNSTSRQFKIDAYEEKFHIMRSM